MLKIDGTSRRCKREHPLNPAGLYHEHGTSWNLLERRDCVLSSHKVLVIVHA